VVDVAGYLPRVVRQTVELLDAPYYLFVSTLSVYAGVSGTTDEESPLLGDTDSEEILEHYGELKAMCERVVQERPGAIVRPGLIVGPHDPTGRFTYWPHRIARGGDVLAPGPPDEPVALIDARDLGAWIVRLCEGRHARRLQRDRRHHVGRVARSVRSRNRLGRAARLAAERVARRAGRRRVDGAAALDRPRRKRARRAAPRVERARARGGLTFRRLEDTARDTLAEAATTDDAGLKPEREAELLAKWEVASRV
jgi:2'-hydroxyisoflavone reductase